MFSRIFKNQYPRLGALAAAICSSLLAAAGIGLVPSVQASPASGTWTQQFGGSNPEVLQFSHTDADHVWASGSYGKVMRTTNGGQTWAVSPMPDPTMVMHSVKFVDNQVGWTAGEWHSQGVLLRSTDGGVTWQQQNEPTGQRLFGVAALDRQTLMVVGGGTYQAITRRSTDGGVTWADMPVPLNDSMFLDIFFLDSSTGWVTGLDGGVAKTTDGGISWQAQSAPHTYGLTRIHFSDPNNGWTGGYYGALLHTTNGGATWTVQNPMIPDYTHVLGVAAVSPSVGWISGYGGGAQSRPYVKKTTDGGNNWVDYTPAVGPYDSFAAVMFLDEENGWAGGYAGIFRRTSTSPPATATVAPTQTTAPAPSATQAVSTATTIPQASATAMATNTQAPVATSTVAASTPEPSATSIATQTATAIPSATRTMEPATATSQPTATQRFSDVAPSDYFYGPVNWLVSRNIVSGYGAGTFRPYNLATRGQLSKMVVLGQGWSIDTTGGPHFSDVSAGDTFYPYVETAFHHGTISGYMDGTFRPGADVTRGQLAKTIVSAKGWAIDTTGGPHFADVAPGSTFYSYVETAFHHGIISGHPDGTFGPGNPATRGQIAKIIYGALNGQ